MIVREQKDAFILIEQDNHAIVSGKIMEHWISSFFQGEHWRSVQYAIKYHDYGWKPFDQQPFWNECRQAPYTFANYPISPKTIIYTFGIDFVEKNDPYAALLCSRHYSRFLLNDTSSYSAAFIEQERNRQQRIVESLGVLDSSLFNYHYELLRFGDDISLYLCLNEPGVSKEKEHYFFQNGIKLPVELEDKKITQMTLHWRNKHTVSVRPFPFDGTVTVKIKQKVIPKPDLIKYGLIKCYTEQPYEEMEVSIVPEE
ncbi:DUF3891 family protein [Niallia oryzisoli]|uniref:DUF3891 family protein n=1 Tax=Niallia oryzisoli TaxID=1737571 RepID=UPI0037361685